MPVTDSTFIDSITEGEPSGWAWRINNSDSLGGTKELQRSAVEPAKALAGGFQDRS